MNKEDFLESYPYLEADEGYWIDANGKKFNIADKYKFDNLYLKKCYLMLDKQYRGIDWDKKGSVEYAEIKDLFEEKLSELSEEIVSRGLNDII